MIRHYGFTIVELMIAVALSLMLAAGAVMIFTSNKQTAVFQEGFARLQENGRFAMDILQANIRMAGGTGCGSAGEILNLLEDPSGYNGALVDFGTAVEGYDYTGDGGVNDDDLDDWTPDLPSDLDGLVEVGTDVIMLHVSSSCGGGIQKDPSTSNAVFFVTKSGSSGAYVPCVFRCDIAMAVTEDCSTAVIFQVQNDPNTGSDPKMEINQNTGAAPKCTNTNASQRTPNLQGGDLYIPGVEYYYIGKATDSGNGEKSSLWKVAGDNNPDDAVSPAGAELVEGITDMQLQFMESEAVGFEDGKDINDWKDVKGVRLQLRVETVNTVEEIEKDFVTSIAIRNKVL